MTTRAVVLARGLGSRMRAPDPEADLTAEQARAADEGHKAMMPVNGRPFLDYVLSGLADAGLNQVALIVAPDHRALLDRYTSDAPPSRLALSFLVQAEARGTADAVLAAEEWAAGEPFLTMNSDNLYPREALQDLARLEEPGVAAFMPDDLMRRGNIPRERINAFAIVRADRDGFLSGIVEKPGADTRAAAPAWKTDDLISMNCWRFDARIFQACRDVAPSQRGELELPEAVGLAVRRGVRFRVLRAAGGVLDLSRRADAAELGRRMGGLEVRL
ncbi:MAG: glucose-phosphate thymidylyltransferase [Acidobacteriota bacterium]|jgi:glucose-1-phosphate thymidylyltransferase